MRAEEEEFVNEAAADAEAKAAMCGVSFVLGVVRSGGRTCLRL